MRVTVELGGAAARLVARGGAMPFPSRGVLQCLERYALLLERAAPPALSAAEWALLREAWGGAVAEPAEAVEDLVPLVADAALGEGFGPKHGVDVRALLARLGALDLAATVALVERLEAARTGSEVSDAGAVHDGADCAGAEDQAIAFPRRR